MCANLLPGRVDRLRNIFFPQVMCCLNYITDAFLLNIQGSGLSGILLFLAFDCIMSYVLLTAESLKLVRYNSILYLHDTTSHNVRIHFNVLQLSKFNSESLTKDMELFAWRF